jgi:hypothetical protein
MKPFTDGELLKDCMVAVSQLMFPEKRRKIEEDISLCWFTVRHRTDDFAGFGKSLINTVRKQ